MPAATAAVEISVRSGFMSPLHAHAAEETVQVLEGSMTVFAGTEIVRLGRGETFVVPGGVSHAIRSDSSRTRAVFSASATSASRYEDFVRALGPSAAGGWSQAEDAMVVTAIAAAAGVTLLGPPGMLPPDAETPARAA